MNSKLVIVDSRCNKEIFNRLSDFSDNILPFRTQGVTYESISCHPDIFIYQDKEHLIIAPNAPQPLFKELEKLNIAYQIGNAPIGELLHDSCFYNCIATDSHLFHRQGFTDNIILRFNQQKKFVALPQSYTRCSMFALDSEHFITSDEGINKALQKNGFHSFSFSPEEIKIAVHRNGFLGGTCGRLDNKILFLGNPLAHPDGTRLCQFIEKNGLEVVSLSNGPLYDGGGLFFLS